MKPATWSDLFRERLVVHGWHTAKGRGRRSLTLDVTPGSVTARIRGRDPAAVTLLMDTVPPASRARLVEELAGKARYAASLLSGRLPEEVEAVFAASGRSLLPSAEEPRASCTCDAPQPCQHVESALQELVRRIAGDPFLLLLLRGFSRDELLAELRARRVAEETAPKPEPSRHAALPTEELAVPEDRPQLFFKARAPLAALRTTFAPAEHPEAVLTRLGPPPLTEPEAASHLTELHRAIGLGAKERLSEWEWRRSAGRHR